MTGAVSEEPEVLGKVEAVIYAMAEKFLEEADMKEVEEAMRMTRLGRMLVEDGREQGLAEGRRIGREEKQLELAKNLLDLVDVEVIAKRTGLPLESVTALKKDMENDEK